MAATSGKLGETRTAAQAARRMNLDISTWAGLARALEVEVRGLKAYLAKQIRAGRPVPVIFDDYDGRPRASSSKIREWRDAGRRDLTLADLEAKSPAPSTNLVQMRARRSA